jgi:hypothetical protein
MTDLSTGQAAGPEATDTPEAQAKGEDLAQAQRDRDPETVGPVAGHSIRRLATSDDGDAHRDWTVQSGVPFPRSDDLPPTRFHPDELPNPDRALEAGFIPLVMPEALVDDDYVTQPPSMNLEHDHPLRDKYRVEDDEDGENEGGPKLNRNVVREYEAAKAQKAGGTQADSVTKG